MTTASQLPRVVQNATLVLCGPPNGRPNAMVGKSAAMKYQKKI